MPCTVGINPMSGEWSVLCSELLKTGQKICCGDFSKFGPRLGSTLIDTNKKIILRWYERFAKHCPTLREDQKIRSMLFLEINNSVQVAGDQLYQSLCGSPSGFTGTVVQNSLAAEQYIKYAWLGIMDETKFEGLVNFDKNVKLFTYGDDVIFSISDDISELFNSQTVSAYFAKFDIKFTDITKNGTIRKYCSIDDATFLKCNFRICEDDKKFRISAIEKTVLEDSINWYRNTQFVEPIMKQICDSVIIQSAGWGRAYFESNRRKLIDYWESVDSSYTPKTYEEVLTKTYGINMG